jgi:hypothetical protein
MRKLRFPFVSLLLLLVAVGYLVTRPAPAPLGAKETQETKAVEVKEANLPPSSLLGDSSPVVPASPTHSPPLSGNLSENSFAPLNPAEIAAARVEMKITLSALYGAQKSFYAEYGRYSTDLNAVGYSPQEKERMSRAGFLRPFRPEGLAGSEDPSFLSLDQFNPQQFKFSRSAKGLSMPNLSNYCRQGCSADEAQFEIIAAAQFSPGAEPDVWVINQNKELVHVNDGATK